MQLQELFRNIHIEIPGGLPDINISGVTADSRQVQPGALFVAVRGVDLDGHNYITDAIQRGAAAVVGEGQFEALPLPYLRARNSRLVFAQLAAAWYRHPSRELITIGVTGTDGKTTTANLIYHILRRAGLKAGMISTVNAVIGDRVLDTGLHVTTPDAFDTQGYLAEMRDAGLTHCVLEATSHGLAQHRIAAVQFDFAVITNITHEHLDYHGSYDTYQRAKGMLFESLEQFASKPVAPRRLAVLNADDPSFDYLKSISPSNQLSYGLGELADVQAHDIKAVSTSGLTFFVRTPEYQQEIRSPLIGKYNVSNCLAAFTLAVHGLGISPAVAASGIEELASISGRMQPLMMGQTFTALVDFAHTPNALLQALQTGQNMTTGKVISVFGSAGLRDRAKRRMMAETSLRYADITILTAEDPRTESLETILEEMAAGALAEGGVEGENFFIVPDRGNAIRLALKLASDDDVVLICGKGHEQSMCFGEIEYPWDDRVALSAALAEYLHVDGPQMPELPTRS
jgi:UDP-N-acetylmuramoyl-L-alanyl-D-glutamate--2,6-diaminopimelate ligase